MSEKNRVLSAYKAVVDGKTTALAGCNTANCERQCLRKDPSLQNQKLCQKSGSGKAAFLAQLLMRWVKTPDF